VVPVLAPGKVRNITGTAMTPTSIQVSWIEPLCPNGIITQYKLYYRQTETRQTTNIDTSVYNFTKDIPRDSISYLITDLTPFRSYGFLVQAFINGTDGELAAEELNRTLSTTDSPPTLSPQETTSVPPTRTQVAYLIADPKQIDTGIVM